MKLKCLPDDFQVEEQISALPQSGTFALYVLTKSSLGTPEAIDAVRHQWKLSREQVAFAGLKDRHALTRQFITIKQGPRRGLKQTNLQLEYIGQVGRPVHAKDITANRFIIVLRDLTDEELTAAASAIESMTRDGLPNYFDSQRFGSVGKSGEFIAKPWCLGDYERALWLALAEGNVHDRPEDRQQKQILRERWGRWPECAAALPDSLRHGVAAFLAEQPGNCKRALTLIPQDQRSIYMAAFQSDLWNCWLAAVLRQECEPSQLVAVQIGPRGLPFYGDLRDDQRSRLHDVKLPLPSARLHLEEGPMAKLLHSVLAEEGIELRQVRLKYPRDTFFSKGERAVVFVPQSLSFHTADDELYRGRKLTLKFDLPRGCYATLVIKRIAGAAGSMDDEIPENI